MNSALPASKKFSTSANATISSNLFLILPSHAHGTVKIDIFCQSTLGESLSLLPTNLPPAH